MLSQHSDRDYLYKAVYPHDGVWYDPYPGTDTNAAVIAEVRGPTPEAIFANARLIAAAPELLAACELALVQMSELAPTLSTASYLRAAIAKARGTNV